MRYVVVSNGCTEIHRSSVDDTKIKNKWNSTLCETFTKKDAKLICKALNEMESRYTEYPNVI